MFVVILQTFRSAPPREAGRVSFYFFELARCFFFSAFLVGGLIVCRKKKGLYFRYWARAALRANSSTGPRRKYAVASQQHAPFLIGWFFRFAEKTNNTSPVGEV